MDFFKKAKTQVKGAVQDAQGMYGQYKQQQQQQSQQQQPGSHQQTPQASYQPTQVYQQPHQGSQGYQQPQQGYQQPQQNQHQQQHGYFPSQQGHQQSQQSYAPQVPAQGYQLAQQAPQPPHGFQHTNNSPGQPAYSPGGYQNAQYGTHPQQQSLGHQQTPTPLASAPPTSSPLQHTQQQSYHQPTSPALTQPPQQSYQQSHQPPSQPPTQSNAPPAPPPPPPNQPYNMNSLSQALPDATHHLYAQTPADQHQASPPPPPPVNQASRPNVPSAVSSPPLQPPASANPPVNVANIREVSQAPTPSAVSPSHAQPPVSLLAAIQSCPRHEIAPVDLVQFHVFQPYVLAQIQPALDKDSFTVCTACFSAYVVHYSNIASLFEPRKRTESHPDAPQAGFEKMYCDFALPTVRQIFYRQCVPSDTVIPLLQFANFASTLPACEGAVQEEPIEYYESKRGDGFGCCKTCYEWFIRSTLFERDMVLKSPQTDWYCDIGARGYSFRVLIADLETQQPDFSRFSSKVKQRNALPFCPGKGNMIAQEGSSGPFFSFEPPNGKSGVICQACYWDKILGTSMEPFFNVHTKLEEQYYDTASCDIAGVPETFAMKAAIRAGDDEVWRRCLVGRETLPKCQGLEGVEEETLEGQDDTTRWYCFTEFPSIEVCPFCYCSTAELLGAGHLFSPITRPLRPGVVRMCYLAQAQDLNADMSDAANFENTLVWRGAMLRNWLHQGYDCHGNFYGLKHVAKAIASWPPPCNSGLRALKPINKRKWYGNKFYAVGDEGGTGIRICQECFEHYVKDTPLESFVGEDLTENVWESLPDGCRCNTQTRRARDELSAACQKGDFLQFSRYWAARTDCMKRMQAMEVRCQQQADKQQQALNVLNQQNQMAAINLMQQLNANTNAIIMGIGGSVAEAASPDYGQRYGNSAVGHGYLTASGANAAQARIDAAAKASEGISVADFHSTGDTWQDTQQLLALSKALDAEWAAIK